MWLKDASNKELLAGAAAVTGVVAAGFVARRMIRNRLRRGPLSPDTLPEGAYDVIVVGAGKERSMPRCHSMSLFRSSMSECTFLLTSYD